MKQFTLCISAVVLFTGLSCSTNAQEFKNPLDFVNEQQSVKLLNDLRAKSSPDLIKAHADYLRRMYMALIDSGFSKDEALKIVVAMAEKN